MASAAAAPAANVKAANLAANAKAAETIFSAIENKDIAAIRAAISANPRSVNIQIYYKENITTPLLLAIQTGYEEGVRLLLENNADIRQPVNGKSYYYHALHQPRPLDPITKLIAQKWKEVFHIAAYSCDKLGFAQHKGECWLDAVIELLFFADGFKELTQPLFYNMTDEQIERYIDDGIARGVIMGGTYTVTPAAGAVAAGAIAAGAVAAGAVAGAAAPVSFRIDRRTEYIKGIQSIRDRFKQHYDFIVYNEEIVRCPTPAATKQLYDAMTTDPAKLKRSASADLAVVGAKLFQESEKRRCQLSADDYQPGGSSLLIFNNLCKLFYIPYRTENLSAEDEAVAYLFGLEYLNGMTSDRTITVNQANPVKLFGHATSIFKCNNEWFYYDDNIGLIPIHFVNALNQCAIGKIPTAFYMHERTIYLCKISGYNYRNSRIRCNLDNKLYDYYKLSKIDDKSSDVSITHIWYKDMWKTYEELPKHSIEYTIFSNIGNRYLNGLHIVDLLYRIVHDPTKNRGPMLGQELIDACRREDGAPAALAIIRMGGADLNYTDRYEKTPLICASYTDLTDVVTALLATEEVDVNAADNTGTTALMTTCMFNEYNPNATAIALVLLNAPGINVNAKDIDGKSALAYCTDPTMAAVRARLLALGATEEGGAGAAAPAAGGSAAGAAGGSAAGAAGGNAAGAAGGNAAGAAGKASRRRRNTRKGSKVRRRKTRRN